MFLRPTLITGIALLGGSLAAQKDTILRKDGKHLTDVTIVKLDLDKITYSKAGKESDILVSRTSGFRWESTPPEFTRAETAAGRKDHVNAAKLFTEAASKAKREPIKAAATFFAGRSYALAADRDPALANNAVAALESYLSAAPTGYYLPEAKVRLARARLAGGDAAGAEAMLTQLQNDAAGGGWPLRWAAHIQFTKAQAQFAQDKFAEARSSFMAVENAVDAAMGQDNRHNVELSALKTEAMVSSGETWIAEKKYNEALSYFQTLSQSTTRGVKAAAHAGQGQILFLQGTGDGDKSKLRQAQLALARAAIEPDTSDSTSAKALFFMGKVLTALGDAEKNALARAKTYFQSVKNNYPNTAWAARARKELDS